MPKPSLHGFGTGVSCEQAVSHVAAPFLVEEHKFVGRFSDFRLLHVEVVTDCDHFATHRDYKLIDCLVQ